MPFLFENLDIYQRAIGFNGGVDAACSKLPVGHYFLADQLKRAALSIAANVAEGSGRWHKNDKRNFYYFSRGSIFECVAILDVCIKNQLLDRRIVEQLKLELTEISKMLTKLIRSLDL